MSTCRAGPAEQAKDLRSILVLEPPGHAISAASCWLDQTGVVIRRSPSARLPHALDLPFEHIAAHHRAHPCRRAGHDDVARLERHEGAEIGNGLGNAPDLSPRSPRCRSLPLTESVMAPLSGWPMALTGSIVPMGADWSKPLGHFPWPSRLSWPGLEIATGHVEAAGIAIDMVERIGDRDIRPVLAMATTSSTSWWKSAVCGG